MGGDVNPAAEESKASYREAPVYRAEHSENAMTRLVEQQAAKIPSNYFLVAALTSMSVSLALELRDRRRGARFVGMWVAPLLIMGVYNKLVKVFGAR